MYVEFGDCLAALCASRLRLFRAVSTGLSGRLSQLSSSLVSAIPSFARRFASDWFPYVLSQHCTPLLCAQRLPLAFVLPCVFLLFVFVVEVLLLSFYLSWIDPITYHSAPYIVFFLSSVRLP